MSYKEIETINFKYKIYCQPPDQETTSNALTPSEIEKRKKNGFVQYYCFCDAYILSIF